MRTWLFTMVDGGGSIPAQLSIVRRLAAAGDRVHVLSDPVVEPEVAAAGAQFIAFERAPHHNLRDPSLDRVRDYAPGSPIAKLRRVGDAVMFGPAEAYARDALAAIERVSPHAVVVDCMLYGAMIAAERSGLPSAVGVDRHQCTLDLDQVQERCNRGDLVGLVVRLDLPERDAIGLRPCTCPASAGT